MGLDQYLYAERYVSNYEGIAKPEDTARFEKIIEATDIGVEPCKESPHLEVQVCVAYWRKANHIHAWFVDNVQDGVDECQVSYVSRDQARTLVELCKEALMYYEVGNLAKAEELLPPRQGFFFGGDNIDEWWEHGTRSTIEQIEPLLKPELEGTFTLHYRSSW